jgi:hypothetical protein
MAKRINFHICAICSNINSCTDEFCISQTVKAYGKDWSAIWFADYEG